MKNLPIDRHWGIVSGDCSVCLERLEKRKVTLKQCEAAVWSGSEFAEHCFVFSNLFVFLSLSCIQNPEPASIPQWLSIRRNFISAIWFRPHSKKNPYAKFLISLNLPSQIKQHRILKFPRIQWTFLLNRIQFILQCIFMEKESFACGGKGHFFRKINFQQVQFLFIERGDCLG